MTKKALAAPSDVRMTRAGGGVIRRIPGDPGIWIFIFLDMLIFMEMFCLFGWYRSQNRELFEVSQHAVKPAYGLLYTVLLLSSSWCVVMAVGAARKGLIDLASKLVLWAFAFGAAFAAIKVIEYSDKISTGITPVTNDFFMFYFVMTFAHLLHATVGLGVLWYVRNQIKALASPSSSPGRLRMIESGAVYWHMIDLLWIVLFALFYLRG